MIYNVDHKLVRAVIDVESHGDHSLISKKGAIGLMQIKPKTAKELKIDPYKLEDNIKGGVLYLSKQLNRFNNIDHALAAYVSGPSTVIKHKGIPPYKSTKKYIKKVNEKYNKLIDYNIN